jgi:hypothetical protein
MWEKQAELEIDDAKIPKRLVLIDDMMASK